MISRAAGQQRSSNAVRYLDSSCLLLGDLHTTLPRCLEREVARVLRICSVLAATVFRPAHAQWPRVRRRCCQSFSRSSPLLQRQSSLHDVPRHSGLHIARPQMRRRKRRWVEKKKIKNTNRNRNHKNKNKSKSEKSKGLTQRFSLSATLDARRPSSSSRRGWGGGGLRAANGVTDTDRPLRAAPKPPAGRTKPLTTDGDALRMDEGETIPAEDGIGREEKPNAHSQRRVGGGWVATGNAGHAGRTLP